MGGSKSAKGGPNPLADMDRGVQIRGGSKSAVTPVVTCSQNFQQNAVKEPKTFDPAVTCAQLQ